MLLTEQWQLIATDGAVLVQKSNKAPVSLCYADQIPTLEKTFILSTREAVNYPPSIDANKSLYARVTSEGANCTLSIEETRSPLFNSAASEDIKSSEGIVLLRAILNGIEIIADQDVGSLESNQGR